MAAHACTLDIDFVVHPGPGATAWKIQARVADAETRSDSLVKNPNPNWRCYTLPQSPQAGLRGIYSKDAFWVSTEAW